MIINLTPHTLNIFDNDGNETTIVPSGKIARINVETKQVGQFEGLPLFETVVTGEPYMTDSTGNIADEWLPEPKDNTIYVVSGLFRQHCDREDFYQPGQLRRDENGKPIGALGLSR